MYYIHYTHTTVFVLLAYFLLEPLGVRPIPKSKHFGIDVAVWYLN